MMVGERAPECTGPKPYLSENDLTGGGSTQQGPRAVAQEGKVSSRAAAVTWVPRAGRGDGWPCGEEAPQSCQKTLKQAE